MRPASSVASRLVAVLAVAAAVLAPANAATSAVQAADTVCYGAQHTLVGGTNPQINVVAFSLLYDCNVHGWQFSLTTSDQWAAASLAQLSLSFDTDGNPATGCTGYDRTLVGDGHAGLEAFVVITPSCDPSTQVVVARAVLVQPRPNLLIAQFTNNDLGNPSSFRWHGAVQGTADPGPERFPPVGEQGETGFPPVPADNPCSPVTASTTQRLAVVHDPARTADAARVLRAGGMAGVSSTAGGVVRFHGDPRAAAVLLSGAGVTADVSTDRVVKYDDVPNDPGYPAQWNLPLINAPAAWSITHGSPNVVVADLDTGVDASHPDLQGKLLPGFDVAQSAPLPATNTDANGHGTAVAGIIAALPNNGLFLAGLGWSTSVVEVKLSNPPSIADIVAGLHWATDHGAQIINLSLGGCSDPTEAAAVSYAQQHNVVVVASAGNDALDGNPVEYPAGYPGVVGVGATARDGSRAGYSEVGSQVALVAPGGSADGNAADDLTVLAPGSATATGAGTSFSAPQVAAVAALVLAASPTLAPDDAGQLAVATAVPTHSSPDGSYGKGMLDAAATLRAAAVLRRIAGPDRYGTAAALARVGWAPKSARVVYVTSGETFADALPTGAAVGVNPGPILLTGGCSLPPATASELSRLKPTVVDILGGPAAVCDAVLQSIAQITGITPTRLAGADRYATNAQLVDATWPATVPVAYVTTGVNFPDGLTGSARAGKDAAPLLLTDTCRLPDVISAELSRLAPGTVKIIGGTNAVCAGVEAAITAAVKGVQIVRIAGADRVQTGTMVAADGWSQATTGLVASAGNFPDALTAGGYAAANRLPLLINDACTADPGVASELKALGATSVSAVGGANALCGAATAPLAATLTH